MCEQFEELGQIETCVTDTSEGAQNHGEKLESRHYSRNQDKKKK